MMTSNVFGSIAAQNLGYARVEVQQAIAMGDDGCRVVVHLKPADHVEPNAREYFRLDAAAAAAARDDSVVAIANYSQYESLIR